MEDGNSKHGVTKMNEVRRIYYLNTLYHRILKDGWKVCHVKEVKDNVFEVFVSSHCQIKPDGMIVYLTPEGEPAWDCGEVH